MQSSWGIALAARPLWFILGGGLLAIGGPLARSAGGTVFGTSVWRTGKVIAIVHPIRKVSVITPSRMPRAAP